MQQRLSLVTLGVSDLAKSRAFYENGLGWKPSQTASTDDVVFFQMGGMVLALYPKHLLAEDANLDAPDKNGSAGFGGITLAYNADSKAAVNDVLALAEKAGAKILKPAQDVFWGGYSGYFADPDDYLWEVAWNPHFELRADGSLVLPP